MNGASPMSEPSHDFDAAAVKVVDALRSRQPAAALAMELGAIFERSASAQGSASLDEVLSRLEASRRLIALDHAPPDRHLEGLDLRAVALVPDGVPAEQALEVARGAADAVWNDWLRQFLATHRCT